MPLCQENVLDIPLSATTIDDNEVVIFTLPAGTSVIRKYGTLRPQTIRYVHTCNGTEGTVLATGLASIPLNKIVDITRTGAGARDIIEVPPGASSRDVQWNTSTGDLTVGTDSPFANGEDVVIIRLA